MSDAPEKSIVTTKVRIPPSLKNAFIDWQTKLNAIIVAFPGFVSLEILSPTEASQGAWIIVQRFSKESLSMNWHQSAECRALMEELKNLLSEYGPAEIQETYSEASEMQGGVTEVFVTQVAPGKEIAYRDWIARIHQAEAKFPGFRGVYVQSPRHHQGENWITLLQFDSLDNLDNWLSSPERKKVLRESADLISALESHRVISAYAGWFASLAKEGEIPPVWKQTMLVLLVLFPIVVLELKYLSPLTAMLNSSLATFISNAISVTLIAWPMMPIAIRF